MNLCKYPVYYARYDVFIILSCHVVGVYTTILFRWLIRESLDKWLYVKPFSCGAK